MASLKQEKRKFGKSLSVIFRLNGTQKCLFLGTKYSDNYAAEIVRVVDRLVLSLETGSPLKRSDVVWLEDLPRDLRERFERAGLLEPEKKMTIGCLWDEYQRQQEKVTKESTQKTYETARKRFLRFFDPSVDSRTVTSDQGRLWRQALCDAGYAEASVAGSIQRARGVWAWAVKAGYVDTNVFTDVKRGSFVNKDREFEVPREWYPRLLDQCPDQCWRTLLALNRIGGLRNPSETLSVRWSDVNWEHGRLRVRSSKTEGHEGRESRVIPLFPELRRELENSFAEAVPGGCPFIIDHWRNSAAYLRKQLEQIIFFAGLDAWPRLFHNLRATRSNEIFREYGSLAEQAWIGHTFRVASSHYLHVSDEDFARAIGNSTTRPAADHNATATNNASPTAPGDPSPLSTQPEPAVE